MALEVRHLRAIVAIAAAGSVSRAATDLGMTQPSLTALLQRLERQVGSQLFDRGRSGATPTPLGEQLVRRAALALAEFDQLETDLRGEWSLGGLRVGISQMDCASSVISDLEGAIGPQVASFTVDSSTAVLAHALARQQHDLSVVVVDDVEHVLPTGVGVRVILPTIPVFLALPSSHPLAEQEEIDLRDLADEAWICPPGADDGSLAELRAATLAAGLEPRVRFTFPHAGGRRLISSGAAVQLVEPASPERPGLAVRRLTGDPVRMRLVLAWHRERVPLSLVETTYRTVVAAYGVHARRSPAYRGWWEDRRLQHAWARQLDPVFCD